MKNLIVSLALYTVSSNVDSISVTADDDGNLLLMVVDDNHEVCQFNGKAWELEEWVKEYNFDLRIDIIEVDLDTKSLVSWS